MKFEELMELSLKEKWIYLEGYKAAIDSLCKDALNMLKEQEKKE